ncbi:MAG: hypothetical protein Q4F88_00580 [Eubacteriales bacterium]|nr:hypothetical protein [Eubacteriales bacterium]
MKKTIGKKVLSILLSIIMALPMNQIAFANNQVLEENINLNEKNISINDEDSEENDFFSINSDDELGSNKGESDVIVTDSTKYIIHVQDKKTKKPVLNANITLSSTVSGKMSGITDSDGNFGIPIEKIVAKDSNGIGLITDVKVVAPSPYYERLAGKFFVYGGGMCIVAIEKTSKDEENSIGTVTSWLFDDIDMMSGNKYTAYYSKKDTLPHKITVVYKPNKAHANYVLNFYQGNWHNISNYSFNTEAAGEYITIQETIYQEKYDTGWYRDWLYIDADCTKEKSHSNIGSRRYRANWTLEKPWFSEPLYTDKLKFPLTFFKKYIAIPDKVPIVGGKQIHAELPDLNMTVYCGFDGRTYIGIGLDLEPLRDPNTKKIDFNRWVYTTKEQWKAWEHATSMSYHTDVKLSQRSIAPLNGEKGQFLYYTLNQAKTNIALDFSFGALIVGDIDNLSNMMLEGSMELFGKIALDASASIKMLGVYYVPFALYAKMWLEGSSPFGGRGNAKASLWKINDIASSLQYTINASIDGIYKVTAIGAGTLIPPIAIGAIYANGRIGEIVNYFVNRKDSPRIKIDINNVNVVFAGCILGVAILIPILNISKNLYDSTRNGSINEENTDVKEDSGNFFTRIGEFFVNLFSNNKNENIESDNDNLINNTINNDNENNNIGLIDNEMTIDPNEGFIEEETQSRFLKREEVILGEEDIQDLGEMNIDIPEVVKDSSQIENNDDYIIPYTQEMLQIMKETCELEWNSKNGEYTYSEYEAHIVNDDFVGSGEKIISSDGVEPSEDVVLFDEINAGTNVWVSYANGRKVMFRIATVKVDENYTRRLVYSIEINGKYTKPRLVDEKEKSGKGSMDLEFYISDVQGGGSDGNKNIAIVYKQSKNISDQRKMLENAKIYFAIINSINDNNIQLAQEKELTSYFDQNKTRINSGIIVSRDSFSQISDMCVSFYSSAYSGKSESERYIRAVYINSKTGFVTTSETRDDKAHHLCVSNDLKNGKNRTYGPTIAWISGSVGYTGNIKTWCPISPNKQVHDMGKAGIMLQSENGGFIIGEYAHFYDSKMNMFNLTWNPDTYAPNKTALGIYTDGDDIKIAPLDSNGSTGYLYWTHREYVWKTFSYITKIRGARYDLHNENNSSSEYTMVTIKKDIQDIKLIPEEKTELLYIDRKDAKKGKGSVRKATIPKIKSVDVEAFTTYYDNLVAGKDNDMLIKLKNIGNVVVSGVEAKIEGVDKSGSPITIFDGQIIFNSSNAPLNSNNGGTVDARKYYTGDDLNYNTLDEQFDASNIKQGSKYLKDEINKKGYLSPDKSQTYQFLISAPIGLKVGKQKLHLEVKSVLTPNTGAFLDNGEADFEHIVDDHDNVCFIGQDDLSIDAQIINDEQGPLLARIVISNQGEARECDVLVKKDNEVIDTIKVDKMAGLLDDYTKVDSVLYYDIGKYLGERLEFVVDDGIDNTLAENTFLNYHNESRDLEIEEINENVETNIKVTLEDAPFDENNMYADTNASNDSIFLQVPKNLVGGLRLSQNDTYDDDILFKLGDDNKIDDQVVTLEAKAFYGDGNYTYTFRQLFNDKAPLELGKTNTNTFEVKLQKEEVEKRILDFSNEETTASVSEDFNIANVKNLYEESEEEEEKVLLAKYDCIITDSNNNSYLSDIMCVSVSPNIKKEETIYEIQGIITNKSEDRIIVDDTSKQVEAIVDQNTIILNSSFDEIKENDTIFLQYEKSEEIGLLNELFIAKFITKMDDDKEGFIEDEVISYNESVIGIGNTGNYKEIIFTAETIIMNGSEEDIKVGNVLNISYEKKELFGGSIYEAKTISVIKRQEEETISPDIITFQGRVKEKTEDYITVEENGEEHTAFISDKFGFDIRMANFVEEGDYIVMIYAEDKLTYLGSNNIIVDISIIQKRDDQDNAFFTNVYSLN